MKTRQPIVTVAGHVDHGKTSILDKIRGTSVQTGEHGGITQKISFTTLPQDTIEKRAGSILEQFKIPLQIPGLMFIDTPGHAAFTNLRKRGGSLADIAILVIDINDGIKPQTAEVLQILKANKTPFIIALNKLDNVSGWKTPDSLLTIDALSQQAVNVKNSYDEKFFTLVGALHSYGINAEFYGDIKDFTKSVAIVPCSAQTGQGMNEILAMITALSQKFLSDQMVIGDVGKGVVLEVKKEKSGNYAECILYDGVLSVKDELAIASFDDVVTTKIRSMQQSLPLNKGFKVVGEATAAAGLRLQITSKQEVLPGMPFQVIDDNLSEIKQEFSSELSEEIQTDDFGIVVKADSLGSLEALLVLLREKQIPVLKAGIGPITKKDVYTAHALPQEDRIILGFNINVADDAEVKEADAVKILTNPVVYQLINDFEEWKDETLKKIERAKLDSLPHICKIEVLDFVFRNSNPAVFGVVVKGGKLVKNERFISMDDEKVGQIKEIQHERNNVQEATVGQEVAISVPGVNFERQLEVGQVLFTNLSESQFRQFKEYKDLLTGEEKSLLKEIAILKRRFIPTWGI